ncbi:MAG: S41 family peptidase [Muribaculaceae bacterium]|nr:S41 family peptidase [Muribaculaceae bacterium]
MNHIKVFTILIAMLSSCLRISASSACVADSIISDFDTLIRIIEDTHPDPYTNHGGRVFYHKHAYDIRNELLSDSNLTVNTLYKKASQFISQLQDGHSFINMPTISQQSPDCDTLMLVKFTYVADALIIDAIDTDTQHLLGSRLCGINGIPIDRIAERIAIAQPCENKAGRYNYMANYFRTLNFYRNLAGDSQAHITLNLTTPAGDTIDHRPTAIHYSQFSKTEKARTPVSNLFPNGLMEWKTVDSTMIFRLSTVQSRENFNFMYHNGWDFYDQLCHYYTIAHEEMPSDTLEAINRLPSMSESFMTMLSEMKARKLDRLIIDLRGNGGGWTPIVTPTLYMMYGDSYLNTDMSCRMYRRISKLYLDKINTSIENFNLANGCELKTGDYLFYSDKPDTRPVEEKRASFINQAFCDDTIKDLLRSLNGKPFYKPDKIYVVTDAGTFSAAFHYAFHLSQMGAIVAGDTSSQAPNCYMEVTPFTLPYSGLSGSISNTLQEFLPTTDPKAREFTPDIRLNYEDYLHFGFDSNSILLHLLSIDQQ